MSHVLAHAESFDRLPAGFRAVLPDPCRADAARLEREVQLASRSPIVTALLDAADSALLVLNEARQIVAYSDRATAVAANPELLGVPARRSGA